MAKKFKDVPEVRSDIKYTPTNTLNHNGEFPEWVEIRPDVIVNRNDNKAITIETGVKWYTRIWYILTNPITYIFAGRIRY